MNIKKFRLIICLVFSVGMIIFSGQAYSDDTTTGQTNANTQTSAQTNTQTNTQQNANANNLTVSGTAIQSPTSTSAATLSVGQTAATYVVSQSATQNIPNNAFFPIVLPLIQGGRVGDVTDQIPNFAGMRKLRLPNIEVCGDKKIYDPGETVNPDKIASFPGHWFWRITLQDVWQAVTERFRQVQQDNGWDPAKMRYRVYYKDRATSGGFSLGGDYGNSFTTQSGTAVQASGGAVMGYGQGTADPIYIVMICEIVEAPLAAKAVEPPPPPRPPLAPIVPPPPPVAIEKPQVTALPVFFDHNKYNIRPDAEGTLQKNLQWFKENPGKKMRIEAYCDVRGSVAYNKRLAQRRADSVKQWFINHGVKSEFLISAIGKTELFGHDGKNEKIYQMNRRVQFVPVQ